MARTLPRLFAVLSLVASLSLGAGAVLAQDVITMQIPPDPANAQISVTVTKGLVQSGKLPTVALREARQAMQNGTEIGPADLRALAEHWDGLAAQKYVRYLLANDPGATPSDIAYFGTIAVSTGRVWTLPAVIEALHRLDPATEPTPRIKAYIAMLYPHAWAGNSLALDAVIDLNGEGRLFGPMSAATQKKITDQGNKAGDGRVPLRLALALLQKPARTEAEMETAKRYLAVARGASNLEVTAIAINLLNLIASGGLQMASKA